MPGRPSGCALRGWSIPLCLAVLLAVSLDVLLHGPLRTLDGVVARAVRSLQGALPWLLPACDAGTSVADPVAVVAVVSCLGAGLAVRERTALPLVRVAAAALPVGAVVLAAKAGYGRTGPPLDILHAGGRSYPSGHTATAVVLWSVAAWIATEHGAPGVVRRAAGVLRWLGPAVAAAAVLLGNYHWLTDVVGAVALGIPLVAAVRAGDARLRRRPVPGWRDDGGLPAGRDGPAVAGPPGRAAAGRRDGAGRVGGPDD